MSKLNNEFNELKYQFALDSENLVPKNYFKQVYLEGQVRKRRLYFCSPYSGESRIEKITFSFDNRIVLTHEGGTLSRLSTETYKIKWILYTK